jgi:alpha-mannosidase
VRLDVEIDNVWRDHRLRMHLALCDPTDRSAAECAFTVVERGLVAEGGPSELGLPTYPARRFVRAGGLTAAFDALTEYELVDVDAGRARTLALTLVRSTGMLSRGPMITRPDPAGPELPLEGAQVQGRVVRRFAIALDADGSIDSSIDGYELADAFVPFPTVRAPGGGDRPATGSLLSTVGAEVSAVRRDGDALVVRAFNPSPRPTTFAVDRTGREVDLLGAVIAPFSGSVGLRPHQILTVALD